MIDFIHQLREQVDAVRPGLWLLLIAFVAGAVMHALKRAFPKRWEALPSRYRAIPPTVIAALLAASASAPEASVTQVIVDTLVGSFSGLTAAGGQEFWTRLTSKAVPAQPDAAAPNAESEDGPS